MNQHLTERVGSLPILNAKCTPRTDSKKLLRTLKGPKGTPPPSPKGREGNQEDPPKAYE